MFVIINYYHSSNHIGYNSRHTCKKTSNQTSSPQAKNKYITKSAVVQEKKYATKSKVHV